MYGVHYTTYSVYIETVTARESKRETSLISPWIANTTPAVLRLTQGMNRIDDYITVLLTVTCKSPRAGIPPARQGPEVFWMLSGRSGPDAAALLDLSNPPPPQPILVLLLLRTHIVRNSLHYSASLSARPPTSSGHHHYFCFHDGLSTLFFYVSPSFFSLVFASLPGVCKADDLAGQLTSPSRSQLGVFLSCLYFFLFYDCAK